MAGEGCDGRVGRRFGGRPQTGAALVQGIQERESAQPLAPDAPVHEPFVLGHLLSQDAVTPAEANVVYSMGLSPVPSPAAQALICGLGRFRL